MPVTTLRSRRLRHSNELAVKNNGAARTPYRRLAFSLLARGANPVSDSPSLLDAKVLSANRVNIDSLHHRCHTPSRDTDNTPSIKNTPHRPLLLSLWR
jgi:hypothetical protein